jgi:hypothetical protein
LPCRVRLQMLKLARKILVQRVLALLLLLLDPE